jgi:hypothetical protein
MVALLMGACARVCACVCVCGHRDEIFYLLCMKQQRRKFEKNPGVPIPLPAPEGRERLLGRFELPAKWEQPHEDLLTSEHPAMHVASWAIYVTEYAPRRRLAHTAHTRTIANTDSRCGPRARRRTRVLSLSSLISLSSLTLFSLSPLSSPSPLSPPFPLSLLSHHPLLSHLPFLSLSSLISLSSLTSLSSPSFSLLMAALSACSPRTAFRPGSSSVGSRSLSDFRTPRVLSMASN